MKRVLIIGDACIDAFLLCDSTRLSPEIPVPVVTLHSVRDNPGMAANVAANVSSLAPDIEVSTLFPKEPSVKTRYVDRKTNHHFLRVDQDATSGPLDIGDFSHVLDADMTRPFDAVILSDYNKGFLNSVNMETIATVCAVRGIPVFCDTKQLLGAWSKHLTYVKINEVELAAHTKVGLEPWRHCQNLIVTCGGAGIDLYNSGDEATIPCILYHSDCPNVEVRDASGCGDTILASLVVATLEGKSIPQAIHWANKVGTVAVSKRGVVAVKRGEVV